MHLHRRGAARSTEPPASNATNGGGDVATIVGELAHGEPTQQRSGRLVSTLAGVLRRQRHGQRYGLRSFGQRMADEVLAVAPRLPVRDLATLRTQFPGRSPDQLAEELVENASRASAAVGAAVGVWALLPVAPLFAVEVAAETLAVAGIEIKLIAELHEVYGLRAPGTAVERMTAYTAAWADRRGVVLAPANLVLAVGPALRRRLSRRLARRAGRSALSLGPLLSGAAAGALANRRETRRLGRMMRAQLRRAARG
jgi:hypothetical protein